MQIQRRRPSLLLWLAFAASGALGCAPKASTTPLGLGPLALAEQAAVAAEKKPARAAHPATPAALATPSVAAASSDAKDDDDGDAKESDATSDSTATPHKGNGKSTAEFSGVFAGKDVAIFRISGMPDRQELDDKARLRLESDSPSQLRIVLINSENGSDLCQLSAEIQGSSAALDGGQPCFTAEGEGAIHAELTSGTLRLNGDRVSLDAEGTLSVALDEEELDGDLSYSFKGSRQ